MDKQIQRAGELKDGQHLLRTTPKLSSARSLAGLVFRSRRVTANFGPSSVIPLTLDTSVQQPAPDVPPNNVEVQATYTFSAGNGSWLTACATGDGALAARVVNRGATS